MENTRRTLNGFDGILIFLAAMTAFNAVRLKYEGILLYLAVIAIVLISGIQILMRRNAAKGS